MKLHPGDSGGFQTCFRGYLDGDCPLTGDPWDVSKPTKRALSAQSLRATSSSSASGAGAFSLKPSKYFPETPSSSSDSQVGAGLRCQLGALDQQPEDGPCTHHRALSAHPAHQHPAPPSGSPEARSCPGSHSAHLQALSCAPLHPRKLLPYPGKRSPDSSRSAPSPHPPPFLKITSSS